MRHLTQQEIERIDGLGQRMRAAIEDAARSAALPILTSGIGSAFGLYVLHGPGGAVDRAGSALLHLAAVNHGVYYGSGGELASARRSTRRRSTARWPGWARRSPTWRPRAGRHDHADRSGGVGR